MGTVTLRPGTFLYLGLLVLAACQHVSQDIDDAQGPASAEVPFNERNPHWATIRSPLNNDFFGVRIAAPRGFPLCGIAESYSNWQAYFVFLDPKQRCEDLNIIDPNTRGNWDELPDFVIVEPYIDVPLNTDALGDYIRNDSFFCPDKRKAARDGSPPASNAPVSITRAGRILMGLNTVACTREDADADRYSRALLAYRPARDPTGRGWDFEGQGVTVGAYVHLENKKAADRLVERVARSIAPLNWAPSGD